MQSAISKAASASLTALLKRVAFDPSRDRLWLVGDLVNRGPGFAARPCVIVRDLGPAAVTVLGNHDLYLLMVAYGSGSQPRQGRHHSAHPRCAGPGGAPRLVAHPPADARGERVRHWSMLAFCRAGRSTQARALAREVEGALAGPLPCRSAAQHVGQRACRVVRRPARLRTDAGHHQCHDADALLHSQKG
jgi:bis(5'-nucleosyl)-tetraphosphatase (symmetrical)